MVSGVTAILFRITAYGALFCGAIAATPAPTPSDAPSFAKVYQNVKPSVVYIVAALPNGAASGSGFIYSSTGSASTIITANHVVEGASRIDVILDSDVHERYAATVVRRDHVRDVAVLSIPVGNRRALALMDPAKIQEGSDIAVVGYPRATKLFEQVYADDLRPSVHIGIISAVRLNGEIIQYDAQTDHGDSGGPVIDKNTGSVVAIVHGALLDQSYAKRGMELSLPGSEYGMSVATINQVLDGAPPASSVAAASTAASTSGAVTGASAPGTIAASAGGSSASASSAAYRVGYGAPHYTNVDVENISQSVLQRLANAFTSQNAFYMIPVQFGVLREGAEQLTGLCDENRLNAIVQPSVNWRAPLVYTATGAPASLEATVTLVVTDCAGDPAFVVQKQKTEGTKFAHRTVPQEVVDMSNDLLDQALRDFDAFRSTHAAAWDSLLKTGIYVDPNDGRYHAMMVVNRPKANPDQVRVLSQYPGGPSARAGVLVGDTILSVNGVSTSGMTPQQVADMFNAAQFALVVNRPGGQTTLTVTPRKYDDLLKSLGR